MSSHQMFFVQVLRFGILASYHVITCQTTIGLIITDLTCVVLVLEVFSGGSKS